MRRIDRRQTGPAPRRRLFRLLAVLFLLALTAAAAVAGSFRGNPNLMLDGLMGRVTFCVPLAGEAGGQRIEPWYDPAGGGYCLFFPSHTTEVLVTAPANYDLSVGGQAVPAGSTRAVALEPDASCELAFIRGGRARHRGLLVFRKAEQIQTLFIDTRSGGLAYLHADKDNREDGDILWVDEAGAVVYRDALVFIKGRGNASFSRSTPKKPYNIRLARPVGLPGMTPATDWALLANYADDSFLRNKIAYNAADEIGLAYSPQSGFVNLYLNGEYRGLYQLSEKAAVGEGRMDIGDLEAATRAENALPLDSYSRFAETGDGFSFKGAAIPADPADITGGYLLEMNYEDRYAEHPSGFSTAAGKFFVIRAPEYASRAQAAYIQGVFQQAETAIFADDGVHPETGRPFTDYIDVESWAKVYLIGEVFKELDSYVTSQYFYKYSDAVDAKLYAGPVWDFDRSLGNAGHALADPEGFYADQSSAWFARLYRHPAFYDTVTRLYAEELLPVIERLLDGGIRAYAADIAAAARMDKVRWTDAGKQASLANAVASHIATFDHWEDNIDFLETFLRARAAFLSSAWLEGVAYHTVTIHTGRMYYLPVRPGDTLPELARLIEANGWQWLYTDDPGTAFDVTQPIWEDVVLYPAGGATAPTKILRAVWEVRHFALLLVAVGMLLLLMLAARLPGKRRPKGGTRSHGRKGSAAAPRAEIPLLGRPAGPAGRAHRAPAAAGPPRRARRALYRAQPVLRRRAQHLLLRERERNGAEGKIPHPHL